jgi:hypothetical protein
VSGGALVTLLVSVILLTATAPIANWLAREEGDERLFWLLLISTAIRFLCTVLQTVVVTHAYGGVADFNGYVSHGAAIANSFHSGHFSLGADRTLGNESVDVVTGMVFLVVGIHQSAAFVVFSWFAMLGMVAFYRALRIAAPNFDRFRYFLLLFFLPSLLFWTAAVGKEAIMTLLLGVSANGAARLLARRPGGLLRLVIGEGLAAVVRPDEAGLMFAALFVGFLLRRRRVPGPGGALGKVVFLALGAVAGFFLLRLAAHSAHVGSLSLGGISHALHKTAVNNSGTGAGYGSSYRWSSGISHYPQDIYTVLFDPLPFQAHSLTQLLASAENSVLLLVIVASWRRLRHLPRALRSQPYVAMAFLYTVLFLYIFAALGNLGLVDRERTLLLPLLVVLLSMPRNRPAEQPAPAAGSLPEGVVLSARRPVAPAMR